LIDNLVFDYYKMADLLSGLIGGSSGGGSGDGKWNIANWQCGMGVVEECKGL